MSAKWNVSIKGKNRKVRGWQETNFACGVEEAAQKSWETLSPRFKAWRAKAKLQKRYALSEAQHLKELRLNMSTELPWYLIWDNKYEAVTRARLRFDLAR